ncbi:MAG: DUF721 domain-containing protein [Terriglobia bacterium]
MEQVGNIVPKALRRQLLCRKPPVREVLFPLWARVVGRLIAQHSRPAAFAGGVLTITVSSKPWAAELHDMSEQIRTQVNAFLGSAVVQKIRVLHRPDFEAPADAHPSLTPANPAPEAGPLPDNADSILWPAGKVGIDPELVGIVERSFVKYFSRPGSPGRRFN